MTERLDEEIARRLDAAMARAGYTQTGEPSVPTEQPATALEELTALARAHGLDVRVAAVCERCGHQPHPKSACPAGYFARPGVALEPCYCEEQR